MPKATIQYLQDAGFRPEQFGTPADFAEADTGYLARVLAEAEDIVRASVGDTAYDAVIDESVGETRIRRAEECAAKAELWARRAAFIDASSLQALDKAAWQERKQYLAQATDAQACSAYWIDEFLAGGDAPEDRAITGMSMGVVASGPFTDGCCSNGATA